MSEPKQRGNYLSVTQAFNLEQVCCALTAAFGYKIYQVGSSLERPDFRDVDLRCILDDGEFDALFGNCGARLYVLNTALSEWISARSNLPVDFQFQKQTKANAEHHGPRSFLGRPLEGWTVE